MRGKHRRHHVGPLGVLWRVVAIVTMLIVSWVLAGLVLLGMILFGLWLVQR